MGRKSDRQQGEVRISATEASRSFSSLLDRVRAGGRYVVHRRGKDVCVMAPPEAAGRRASEVLALVKARAPVLLDGRFGEDLLDILAGEPVEERPSWGS